VDITSQMNSNQMIPLNRVCMTIKKTYITPEVWKREESRQEERRERRERREERRGELKSKQNAGQEELQVDGIPRAVMARNMTHKIVYRPMVDFISFSFFSFFFFFLFSLYFLSLISSFS
jgi:hypothetical protein